MTQEKTNRINELSRKSRVSPLSDAELKEQKELRDEYRNSINTSITGHLENLTIVNPDGTKVAVKDMKRT